jgi:hypothetical protein
MSKAGIIIEVNHGWFYALYKGYQRFCSHYIPYNIGIKFVFLCKVFN